MVGFIEAANLREPAMSWFHGVATTALMALDRLSDDRYVGRKYLTAAKKLFGDWIEFRSFTGSSDGAYATDASTSNDQNHNTKMEKTVNTVWKRVQVDDDLSYTGADAPDYLEAGAVVNPRIILPIYAEFEEDNNKHAVVFKDGYAYAASWVTASSWTPSDTALLIHRANILPAAYTGVEMLEVRGERAADELLAAFGAVAVYDMLKAVRGRAQGTSIKNAVARSLGYRSLGYAGFTAAESMWFRNNTSRNWSYQHHWFGAAAAVYPRLNKDLERMRKQLGMEGLEGTEFLRGYDRFTGDARDRRADILQRMKQLALRGLGVAKKYGPLLAAGDGLADAAGGAPGLAVAAGKADAAGAGDFANEFIEARQAVEVGGADLCIIDDCEGGDVYDVVPVEEGGVDGVDAVAPGVGEVFGAGFGRRIGRQFAEYIGRIEKATAIEDTSAQNKELQKLIADLHQGLLETFVAFQIHADGSLKRLEAELMLRGERMQEQEDRYKQLAEVASTFAVLRGRMDYLGTGLTEEEPHISDRKMRHSVAYDHVDIGDGRKATVAMLRIKEGSNKSKYVAFPSDVVSHRWWMRG